MNEVETKRKKVVEKVVNLIRKSSTLAQLDENTYQINSVVKISTYNGVNVKFNNLYIMYIPTELCGEIAVAIHEKKMKQIDLFLSDEI